MYASCSDGDKISFQMLSNSRIESRISFTGSIQIAKCSAGSAVEELAYDASAGVFAVGANIVGSTTGRVGTYSLSWAKSGPEARSRQLLMFALPHHVESFDPATNAARVALQLQTTTKGTATAVLRDSWTMVEGLPTDIGFRPWSPAADQSSKLSARAFQVINEVAIDEIGQDMNAQTNLDSMYFSGKVNFYLSIGRA